MDTERKVVVITGASQGIGAGLVEGFLGAGFRVVANSRSIKPSGSPDVLAVPGDISDPAVAARVVAAALEGFGRVDTLVNNAGAFLSKPFADFTEADFAAQVALNLGGFFHVTQHAARHMLAAGRGHVVNITTALVAQPVKGVPAAMAALTKGGLDAVTRSLAIEYADRGIRVNAVSPGVIDTPMHPPENHAFLAGLHPVGRLGRVQDVVDAVLYLESASFVTGTILDVDGGAHAGRW